MGCHNNENKLFTTQKANGIMGLAPAKAGGAPTVLSELFKDKAHVQTSIFAMCLSEWGGRLVVGGWNASYHLSAEITWVPMTVRRYYVVGMESLSLDGKNLGTRSRSLYLSPEARWET